MTEQVVDAVEISAETSTVNKTIIAVAAVSLIAVGAVALFAKLRKKSSEEEILTDEPANAS